MVSGSGVSVYGMWIGVSIQEFRLRVQDAKGRGGASCWSEPKRETGYEPSHSI